MPDGERFKQLPTVGRIYDALIRADADRATAIVAVGGGVVGDIAGFAAATYLRGVPVVQVPTTLLAQVDSAIGGKVGVNHAAGKNLIGAFHQPPPSSSIPSCLTTLPRREFRAGLYEVVKYGVIASRPLFDRIRGQLTQLFARDAGRARADHRRLLPHQRRPWSSRTSAKPGPRRVLNFGHTAGHALEAVTNTAASATAKPSATACSRPRAYPSPAAPCRRPTARRSPPLIAQMGPLPPVSRSVCRAGRSRAIAPRQEGRRGTAPLRAGDRAWRDEDRR